MRGPTGAQLSASSLFLACKMETALISKYSWEASAASANGILSNDDDPEVREEPELTCYRVEPVIYVLTI